MPYIIPTLPDLIATSQKNIQSRLLNVNTAFKNSVVAALAYNQGAINAGLYHYVKWVSRQAVPHLADDDMFLAYAREAGIQRKPASIAKGTIRIRSSADVTIPKATRLQRSDGTIYIVAEEVKGHGEIIAHVHSEDAGIQFNAEQDEVLTFITPIFRVENQAYVVSIIGGEDREPIAEVIERYIYRFQYPPMGGHQFDYVRWMREIPGISRAWCYKRVHGGNTVGVAWVYDNRYQIGKDQDLILPTDSDIESVLAYIDTHPDPITGITTGAPMGAEVIPIKLTLKPINPVIIVSPDQKDVRDAVTKSVKEAIEVGGMPNDGLPRTHLTQAISNAAGEYDHKLLVPDLEEQIIAAGRFELLTLGEIEWR